MENLGELKNECALCKKPFTEKENEEIEIAELKGKYYHKKCYLASLDEDKLEILLVVAPKSIGDSISHTPLIKELKRIYPKANLDVLTVFPDLFKWNPLVRNVIPWQDDANASIFKRYHAHYSPFDTKNPHFPLHMLIHSVDFVSLGMFRKILKPQDKQYEVFYTYEDVNKMKKICSQNDINVEKETIVLIHPHKAYWETRTWSKDNWQIIVNMIKEKFSCFKIVSIGGDRSTKNLSTSKMDNRVELEGCIDLYNKLSLLETLALMDKSNLLITLDTGPLHLASASSIKIACAFSVVNSMYRLPYRNGSIGDGCYYVDSACNCSYDLKFITEELKITKCPRNYTPIKCLDHFKEFCIKVNEALWDISLERFV